MELRSSHRKDEYKELQLLLNGMGFHEEGMELQEMHQILDALQMSASENETPFLDCDIQQALRESELDFMPTQDGHVLNSTMIIHPSVSPCNSPDISPEIIVVQAEVHHSMDWSPHNESLNRKRFAFANMAVENEIIPAELEPNNESSGPEAKRFHNICAPTPTINNIDTEINIVEENAINTTANINNLENSLQISTSSSLSEMHGSFLERRVYDSGFIKSFGTPNSSVNNTSSNVSHPSTISLNNLEKSFSELSNSIHEIVGPFSRRRIHDSGVNISTEMHENENLSYSLGNSMQNSTSSAVSQNHFNDDSEPSI